MTSKWIKRLAAMLALCTALSVTGCNGDNESSSGDTSAATAEATVEAEEVMKVGCIYYGDAESGGITTEINSQRAKALQHSKVESVYIDNVSITDFEAAVKVLVEDGCTHIISCSPVYTNALSSTAGKYMNIDFIGYGSRMRSVNIYAYTEQPFQGAYIAGLAAAYNSEAEKIGIVVDQDMLYYIPVINAAALGMQLVYSDAQMMVAYGTRDNEVKSAVDCLKDNGCDVIICYTETAASAEYCEKKGIKFVGCMDYTETADSYENMLMYFYTKRDSFFLSQFKQIALDTWEADSYIGSMENSVINVSPALPAAKDGTQDIMNALIPKVRNGQAYIFEGELKDTSGAIKYMQNDVMELAEIYDMPWYVLGVKPLENFRQPQYELDKNPLEIKH